MRFPGILELMTRLGYPENALEYLRPADDAGLLVQCTGEIIRALDPSRPDDEALLFRLLRQAIAKIRGDPEAHFLLAQLLRNCPSVGGAEMRDLLRSAAEVFNTSPNYWATPRVLAELARLTTSSFRPDAAGLFTMTLQAIPKFTRSSRSREVLHLFTYWSAFDAQAAAVAFATLPIQLDAARAQTIAIIARTLAASGNASALPAARDRLRSESASYNNPFELAGTLIELAAIELDLANPAACRNAVRLAIQAIEHIGLKDAGRLQDAATSRIHLVPVYQRLNVDEWRRALDAAWASLRRFGAAEASLRTLVQEQLRADAASLLPLIEAMPDPVYKGLLLVAAGLELLPEYPAQAREMMIRALVLADSVPLR